MIGGGGFRRWAVRPGVIPFRQMAGGSKLYWERSFDQPAMEPDEVTDARTFRERCGCLGDVAFHERVREALWLGEPVYVCDECGASWILGD